MCNEKTSENSAEVTQPAELHTPAEWCALAAVEVLDPEGWRVDGKSWDDPINADEFKTRFHGSTWRLLPLTDAQISEEIAWRLLRRPSSGQQGRTGAPAATDPSPTIGTLSKRLPGAKA